MPHFLMRPLYVGEINKVTYYNNNMASNDQANSTKTYEDWRDPEKGTAMQEMAYNDKEYFYRLCR